MQGKEKVVMLRNTRRYAGLLPAPAGGFGQEFVCPSSKKRDFHAVCAYFIFWCSVVTSVMFNSNLSNFVRNAKKHQKK